MRLFLVVAAVWLTGVGNACLNDRDTLRREAMLKPDIFHAIIGWFDRMPEEYYRARIELIEEGTPAIPELDDLSVAYDRVGQPERAAEIIEPKLLRMRKVTEYQWTRMQERHPLPPKLMNKLGFQKYHTYSYHANYGTFLVNDWLKHNRDGEQLDEAILQVRTALNIYPEAHDKREWVQLRLMEWMREGAKGLPKNLEDPEFATGLAGLITWGAAWESPDAFRLLAHALVAQDDGIGLAQLALERERELLAAGKKMRWALPAVKFPEVPETDRAALFRELRGKADTMNQSFQGYVRERLAQGLHPDTHPEFWDQWQPPRAPTLPGPKGSALDSVFVWIFPGGLAFLGMTLVLLKLRKPKSV